MTTATAIVSLLTPAAQAAAGHGAMTPEEQAQGSVFAAILNGMQQPVFGQTPQANATDPAAASLFTVPEIKPAVQPAVQTEPVAPAVTQALSQQALSQQALSQPALLPASGTPQLADDTPPAAETPADTSVLATFAAFVAVPARPNPQPEPDTAPAGGTTTPKAEPAVTAPVSAIEMTPALAVPDEGVPTQLPPALAAQLAATPAIPAERPATPAKPATGKPAPDTASAVPKDPLAPAPAATATDKAAGKADAPVGRGTTDANPPTVQPAAAASPDAPRQVDPLGASAPQAAQPPFSVELRQAANLPISSPAHVPVPLDALAVHIARKAEQGLNQFEITLTPGDLGKLDISLKISDDGRVHAVLRAERQDTLDLLKQDARTLENQLRQAGLDVNAGALSFHLSQGNPHRYRQDDSGFSRSMTQGSDEQAPAVTASTWIATRKRDGIDIHV